MSVDLENIIRELTPGLIRYCTARTRDRGLAEEIAQDSLTALVQRWKRHGAPDSPEAFAFAVARRRSARIMARRRLWLPLQTLIGRQDHSPDPESTTMARRGCADLLSALEHLSLPDREALLIVAVAGLNIPQAARVLDISESALKMRILRARQRLHTLMEDHREPVRR
jgi:RNA polymerase sigma-70 factor (ECF subfamily)